MVHRALGVLACPLHPYQLFGSGPKFKVSGHQWVRGVDPLWRDPPDAAVWLYLVAFAAPCRNFGAYMTQVLGPVLVEACSNSSTDWALRRQQGAETIAWRPSR